MDILGVVLSALSFAVSLAVLLAVVKSGRARGRGADLKELSDQVSRMQDSLMQELRGTKNEFSQSMQSGMRTLGELLSSSQQQTGAVQDKRLRELTEQLTLRQESLQKTVGAGLAQSDERLHAFSMQNEQKLENIRNSMAKQLASIQEDNASQLEKMRATVDEKLQKTMEERIGQSFKLVSERLEQVYKGLGEMQTLATGVGDLKKVLSNVKTRGILGEIQLGSILEQILPPEQYEQNIVTKKGSGNPVEYAIRMPGGDEGPVYLPVDAKFPADAYSQLVDAYDSANPAAVEAAAANLVRVIRQFAKDIHDKYIDPPNTTDFGIMFLPFEGLYAEVVRRGLVEILQRDYKISIAGPTTMAAFLNSLQMGFRTLAIQKRSGEVWRVLGAVKTEFDKFGDVLENTQRRLEQANSELDKLVGVRTRQIRSKLRTVTVLDEEESRALLSDTDDDSDTPVS